MISIKRTLFLVLILFVGLVTAMGPCPANAQNDTPQPAKKTAAPPQGEQLVSIDFNNVDIVVFIKFISDLTKRNFIIDEKVKGKVTIISPGKITVKEAYRVFQSVLEVNGLTTVPSGQVTKIVRSPDARSKSIRTRLEEEAGSSGDSVVTQIIPLRYADPNEIKKLFTPLVSKNSVILSYPPTNTLIITDVHSNIRRLQRILNAIDITGVGQQIAIIPVEYADATKLTTLLSSIFKSKKAGKGVVQKDITFVADERTNAIVLLASEGDTDNIRKLIKSLDKETPRGQAKIHVYYLEHASAEDLSKVLQDIPQKSSTANKKGKKTAPVVSDDVRISADKATNSLIIMAAMEDYIVLEDIIRKIDIPRAMVYIEALIMEVNVTKNFQLGTEYLLGGEGAHDGKDFIVGGGFNAGGEGALAGAVGAIAAGTTPLTQGFSLGLFGENIEINGITFPTISSIIQAFKRDTDTHILSTPQILTTDNTEAKISVGQNVPFQTSTTASTTGSNLFNSFEYRDVGTTLTITPHISQDRMVRLDLALEVSDLQGTALGGQPITLKRTVDTTAIVKDGNTVVLGGLIDEQFDRTVNKVPCLGDIPGLGLLFSSRSDSQDKSNLYIFLTPRVIQTPSEASNVAGRKRQHIDKLREEKIKLFDWDARETPPSFESEPPSKEMTPNQDQTSSNPDTGPKAHLEDGHAPTATGSLLPSDAIVNTSAVTNHETLPDSIPDETEMAAGTSEAAEDDHAARSLPSDSGQTLDNAGSPSPMTQPSSEQAVTKPAVSTQPQESADAIEPEPATSMRSQQIKGFTIQVGAVQSVQQSDRLLKELIDMGYAAYTVQSNAGEKSWYRVRVGFFDNQTAAKDLLKRLRSDRFDPILISF